MFPGLDRSREGNGLEARFNAFKIPESNFLVFEATVKTCREGCQPVSVVQLFIKISFLLAFVKRNVLCIKRFKDVLGYLDLVILIISEHT